MAKLPKAGFSDRHYRIRYLGLTIFLAVPLLISFISLRNVYPAVAWTVMMSGGSLDREWTYYVVRGETISGEFVDINPTKLTNGLYGRTWSLVRAAVNNDAFKLASPHPQNYMLLESSGGFANLPPGARVNDLLSAWGNQYNAKLPASSPDRLKAVRVDVYLWNSKRFGDYDRLIESWQKIL